MSATSAPWTALKCCTLNDLTLPFYNCLFVGAADASAFGINVDDDSKEVSYVEAKISENEVVVYPIRHHKDVPAGSVVVSKPQRGGLGVSVNESVYMRSFRVDPKVNFTLERLRL